MRLVVIRSWVQEYGFLVLGLCALVAINALWLIPVAANMRQSTSRLTLETVNRVGTTIELDVGRDLDALIGAAEELGLTPDRYEFILKRLLSRYEGFHGITFYRPDGTEFFKLGRVSTPTLESGEGEVSGSKDAAMEAFDKALAGEPGIGHVFVSDSLEPRTMLAASIRELGTLRGVLVGELNLRTLITFVRDIPPTSGHLYVVDRDGFQILHPDLAEFLHRPNYFTRPIVQKVVVDRRIATGLAAEDGYTNTSGVRVFAAGRPLSVGGWGIILEQPRRMVLASEQQMMLLALGIVVFGTCALIFIYRNQHSLRGVNLQLRELLIDIDNAGKLLVRRDLELSEANAQLRDIDHIKSEFVSVAAHQLRTPLTGIKWSLNALLSGEFGSLSQTQTKTLGAVLQTANRLVFLIGDLLNVARLEEGRYGLRIEVKSPESLIRSVVERFEHEANEVGISYSFDISPVPLAAFPHDPQSVSLILENLLDNAIQYTKRGGSVSVAVHLSETMLTFSISDTGIGILHKEQIKMFTKFFRAPNAQKLRPNGTGLGLYLTKSIIERNRGTLTYESVEGKGSTFTVSLPRIIQAA